MIIMIITDCSLYNQQEMFQLASQTTSDISVDCIKTCPYEPNLVAMAYYQTNPTTLGAISVTHIHSSEDIQQVKPVACPPLLHLVWGRSLLQPDNYIIAAASRTNDVLFYSYQPSSKTLLLLKTINIEENIFCLYLDLLSLQTHYQLLISSNESSVINLTLDSSFSTPFHDTDITSRSAHRKHEYAVWTCRLDPHEKNAFVCGDEVNSIYHYIDDKLVCKNSTSHKGGICDVVFRGEYEMYSGGFDGLVCSYDRRKLGSHVSQADWGGTIWRVVPNLVNKEEIILCNSSENRFQVVDSGLKKELWNSGEGHGSLAYAADWNGTDIVAASFYDKSLCYWKRSL